MKSKYTFTRLLIVPFMLWSCLLAAPLVARGQGGEQEPNNTCAAPQNVGAVTLPFVLNGNLNSTQGNPDVDFFRFTGTPNTAVVVTLEGNPTGGTLDDPYLGLFNSACTLMATDDDSGGGLNSRLQFLVPADGVFIMAVTGCCDSTFHGGDVGTYRLTVAHFQALHSIIGTVTDAVTGAGLPGNTFPFARVELRRCSNGQCFEFVNAQSTDAGGGYSFDHDNFGRVLPIGTYQVLFSANLYVAGQTQPFTVAENEDRNLGNFALTPLPRAGSISGRLVDATTRQPLPGNTQPFAFVQLYRCDQFGCFNTVASQNVDSQGRFHFDRDFSGNPLLAASYQIRAFAISYQTGQSPLFTVAENENKNIGDVLVPPFPIRFTDVRPCANIPAAGGTCVFSVSMINGLPTTLNARTWTLVNSFATGSFLNSTLFPAPEPPITPIPSGATRTVQIRFEVPGSLRPGAVMCPAVYVGQALSASNPAGDKNTSYFNTLGQISNSFCIVKLSSGFNVLTEQETRTLLRQTGVPPLVVDPTKH